MSATYTPLGRDNAPGTPTVFRPDGAAPARAAGGTEADVKHAAQSVLGWVRQNVEEFGQDRESWPVCVLCAPSTDGGCGADPLSPQRACPPPPAAGPPLTLHSNAPMPATTVQGHDGDAEAQVGHAHAPAALGGHGGGVPLQQGGRQCGRTSAQGEGLEGMHLSLSLSTHTYTHSHTAPDDAPMGPGGAAHVGYACGKVWLAGQAQGRAAGGRGCAAARGDGLRGARELHVAAADGLAAAPDAAGHGGGGVGGGDLRPHAVARRGGAVAADAAAEAAGAGLVQAPGRRVARPRCVPVQGGRGRGGVPAAQGRAVGRDLARAAAGQAQCVCEALVRLQPCFPNLCCC